ncbi:MAG: RimK family alpha-L-glutamate ligase [Chloroflexota bacterium]
MILVCGGLADTVTEVVCARLADSGYPYRFLDLATYPSGYDVRWEWRGSPTGYIATADWKLDLDEVTGVFIRFVGPEGRRPDDGSQPELRSAIDFEYDTGLMALFEDLPCIVVNRIAGGMSNNSKPYQALLVRRSGLLTPPTIVTNDPDQARAFVDEFDGAVVYKSLSGIRSVVRRVGPDKMARLPFLRHGPAQFQAFIPGTNVRVHTVGDSVFATRVSSDAVDYRYARREGGTIEMEPSTLPDAVAASCLQMAGALGLEMSGIDLKETPDGQFYCFEINPSPGFLYYEQHTRQPISAAVADLLHRGRPAEPWMTDMPMA